MSARKFRMARWSDGVPEKMQIGRVGSLGTNLQCPFLVRSTRQPCSRAALARSLKSILPVSLYDVKDNLPQIPNAVRDFLRKEPATHRR